MADVSKIKVPNGTVYDLKDETARAGLAGKADANHTHSEYASKSKYEDKAISVGRKANTTVGLYSSAVGQATTASGHSSHAEGINATASGDFSHAEGSSTTASGNFSHAEGSNTTASGRMSHSEGHQTTASGDFSHAGGYLTNALHDYEVAYGTCNKSNADTLFSIGDGSDLNNRHNAFEITTTGGKLHDKDIATTDLIPTSLPANGGTAYTISEWGATRVCADLDNAELGFSAAPGDAIGAPNTFWSTVLTTGQTELYRTQIAFPWAYDGISQKVKYRSKTNGIWSEWENINDGGNADTLDGHHADYFAKYDNPSIEGQISLVRAGNATTAGSIFAWEDTLRLRNQDPNAENTTYTDLLLTPSGIFTEGVSNGNYIVRKEISTTPIKKISFPSVATNAGGGGVLFSADFGTPITIACTSRGDTQCTPFYHGDSNQWLLLAKDCATLAPIPAGSYSFDVWYI